MRFHELSLPTADIRASVEFYERLGFTQAQTGDIWPHPYGVLTDGRIVLGLHQQDEPHQPRGLHQPPASEPSVTFVRPDVACYADELEQRGLTLEYRHTSAEQFHRIGLRDPAGQRIAVLEARTYSPPGRGRGATSLCGAFAALGLPAADFTAARRFWEPLGFVATEERDEPFAHLALTSDHLDLLFHRLRGLPGPTLVFADADIPGRIARLRAAGLEPAAPAPAGLDPASALLVAPEGTRLLWMSAELLAAEC